MRPGHVVWRCLPGKGRAMTDASERLLREIELEVAETQPYTGRGRLKDEVLAALRATPRERFVPPALQREAFGNYPLPIGYGQTISQPYIVAIMTELLDLGPQDRVLEIGTGSGYQAAVLSHLAKEVFSVDNVAELSTAARRRFEELGYHNIQTRVGDGYFGWPEEAPFDAIIVTAAPPRLPPPLLDQLAPGGRLIAPLESARGQELVRITKDAQGDVRRESLLPVAFVPLTGRHRPEDARQASAGDRDPSDK
jgi:protein-L-isoaspartate(D-aspartate) O-methyltransferase